MNAEAVSTLRHRLNAFKDSFGDDLVGEALNECDSTEAAARRSAKRAAKRRNGNCMDTLIDGRYTHEGSLLPKAAVQIHNGNSV